MLTDEQVRALLLLARCPNGCTEAMLIAHGFPIKMLEELVTTGLAKASPEEMRIARKRRKVICFQITEAGRKAAAECRTEHFPGAQARSKRHASIHGVIKSPKRARTQ
jgi:hypothetical protein